MTDILVDALGQVINKHLVPPQWTLCAFWLPLGNLESLPMDGHVEMGVIMFDGVKDV